MSINVVHARNVQDAYVKGLALVRQRGVPEETRNGPALVVPGPVMTVYERPIERVLLDPSRDANPFFHLMEAMWMLAGRRDVASLAPFNAGLARYSDDGVNYHGAYGHRWREHFENGEPYEAHTMGEGPTYQDQLRRCIELLRANPSDRRVVLTMWDPEIDLGREGLDFPCNTQVYFRGRLCAIDETKSPGERNPLVWTLDMTITCRSNDAIWGAYGANAVHFSVLQEFVAAAAGMRLGTMYQLSNNLHAYQDVLERVGVPELWQPPGVGYHGRFTLYDERVPEPLRMVPTPLFRTDSSTDLDKVFSSIDGFWTNDLEGEAEDHPPFTEDGLWTLECVRNSYMSFKIPERAQAHGYADIAPNTDWRRACLEWLERRYSK